MTGPPPRLISAGALALALVLTVAPVKAGEPNDDSARRAFLEGRFAAALELADDELTHLRPGDHVDRSGQLTLKGLVLSDMGRFIAAREALDRGLRELTGSPQVEALVDNLIARGVLAQWRGDGPGARAAFAEADRWLGTLDVAHSRPAVALARARLALAGGRHERGRAAVHGLLTACADQSGAACRAVWSRPGSGGLGACAGIKCLGSGWKPLR